MAGPKLRVNAAFAERYGRYRQREELQRLRDRYGDPEDSEGSDSSDSSGDNPALDPREEREFYRTLALLKSRDPRIYQKDAEFYTRGESEEDEDDDEDDEDEDEEGDEEPPARPMFLKDYERKVVLEKEGKYVDEEDEEDEEAAAKRRKVESSRSYVEEQRELRDRLRAFVADSDEEEGEGQGGGALLKPRLQTREEKEQEQQQYLLWLRGQAEPPPEPLQDLEPLQRFWTDPGLEPGEKFLRDFLLGNGRGQEEEEEDEGAPQDPLEDSSEEGEQFLEQQQEFERRHNFRFEEPGAAQVQTFPRLIPSSVRRRDERRKEKREQTRQRKRKERERRREELKQLKNLKRQELEERLRKIREASGGSGGAVGISGAELEEDFDPQGHDRMMAEWFGEEFYGRAEEEKPQFQEEEGLDDDWNWDSWTGREEEPPREPHCEDPDFVMDADFVPGAPPDPAAPPGRAPPEVTFGKRRRKSRFREALEREKPPFDPASGPFERYLDEFYSLDFEDVVGDLPCRFKYRRVLPCDFGLSTDEILAADDKELNRWCSLRKTCMYRSEQEERQDQANYTRRAQNLNRKHQILRSLLARPDNDDEDDEPKPTKAKFGKKHRMKKKRLEKAEKQETPQTTPNNLGGPRRRGGPPLGPSVRLGGREFTGRRLEAFGLNPRRIRFRQLRKKGGKMGGKGEKMGGNSGKNPGKNHEKNPGNILKNPGKKTEKNLGEISGKTEKNFGKNPEKKLGKNPGNVEKNLGKKLEKNPGKNLGNTEKNFGKNLEKNAWKSPEGTGTTRTVNGKKQKRRKNSPNPQKNT